MNPQKYKNLTASGLVKTGAGTIKGIVIASHTSGTIKLWDAVTAAVPVLVNTMTLVAGERQIHLFDANFTTGLYVTIAGTADITVIYN
jgi:hypothetical protein